MFVRTVLAVLLLGSGAAFAGEPRVIADADFPEGPFVENGTLYFAQYGAHQVTRGTARRSPPWEAGGLGRSSRAALRRAAFSSPATTTAPMLSLLGRRQDREGHRQGQTRQSAARTERHRAGRKGGAYVTASGPGSSGADRRQGLHRRADGNAKVVADDLHYANGIVLSAEGRTLYRRRALREPCHPVQRRQGDGSLSDRRRLRPS